MRNYFKVTNSGMRVSDGKRDEESEEDKAIARVDAEKLRPLKYRDQPIKQDFVFFHDVDELDIERAHKRAMACANAFGPRTSISCWADFRGRPNSVRVIGKPHLFSVN